MFRLSIVSLQVTAKWCCHLGKQLLPPLEPYDSPWYSEVAPKDWDDSDANKTQHLEIGQVADEVLRFSRFLFAPVFMDGNELNVLSPRNQFF